MSLSVTVTPGYVFGANEEVTNTKLNQAATPTVNLAGAAGSSAIADGAVTTTKIADANVTTAKISDANVTAAKLASDALIAAQMAPAGTAKKLVLGTAAGAGATHQVTISADAIVLANLAGVKYQATTVSVTADIASAGANGLDTGAEAGNTWYYVWVIYDPVGGTVASLLSTATALSGVTLPGNYSYGALVGAVRNDGSSNFTAFTQQGREIYYTGLQNAVSGLGTAGSSLAYAGSVAGVVPTIATGVSGYVANKSNSSNLQVQLLLWTASTGIPTGVPSAYCCNNGSGSLTAWAYAATYYAMQPFQLPYSGSYLWWATCGTTANGYAVAIRGFTLPINAV